jgi:hypothetical protein
VKISFDPRKSEENLKKHGLSLADSQLFDFDGAIEKLQFEGGEERIKAFGEWNGEFIAVVVFVDHGGEVVHVVSARRAERQEILDYVREKSGA